MSVARAGVREHRRCCSDGRHSPRRSLSSFCATCRLLPHALPHALHHPSEAHDGLSSEGRRLECGSPAERRLDDSHCRNRCRLTRGRRSAGGGDAAVVLRHGLQLRVLLLRIHQLSVALTNHRVGRCDDRILARLSHALIKRGPTAAEGHVAREIVDGGVHGEGPIAADLGKRRYRSSRTARQHRSLREREPIRWQPQVG
mmetsp:Transcript_6328/g.13136  ORF Transcript_6328/g.13136 Transcript_6328/m.13136 type:complete len:200 (-) Transcript_6328:212-811(-)